MAFNNQFLYLGKTAPIQAVPDLISYEASIKHLESLSELGNYWQSNSNKEDDVAVLFIEDQFLEDEDDLFLFNQLILSQSSKTFLIFGLMDQAQDYQSSYLSLLPCHGIWPKGKNGLSLWNALIDFLRGKVKTGKIPWEDQPSEKTLVRSHGVIHDISSEGLNFELATSLGQGRNGDKLYFSFIPNLVFDRFELKRVNSWGQKNIYDMAYPYARPEDIISEYDFLPETIETWFDLKSDSLVPGRNDLFLISKEPLGALHQKENLEKDALRYHYFRMADKQDIAIAFAVLRPQLIFLQYHDGKGLSELIQVIESIDDNFRPILNCFSAPDDTPNMQTSYHYPKLVAIKRPLSREIFPLFVDKYISVAGRDKAITRHCFPFADRRQLVQHEFSVEIIAQAGNWRQIKSDKNLAPFDILNQTGVEKSYLVLEKCEEDLYIALEWPFLCVVGRDYL